MHRFWRGDAQKFSELDRGLAIGVPVSFQVKGSVLDPVINNPLESLHPFFSHVNYFTRGFF
jgi:hypothetical protein